MSEVGAPDRSRLLRSKRAELSGIVTSRKRKLREFFAVCDNEVPIPTIDLSNPDAPPTTAAEAHFLDVTDILQNRLFDESNLPTRRQLRSDTSKQKSPIRKPTPESRPADALRKATKLQRDGSRTRKSRAATPSARSDGGRSATAIESGNAGVAVHEVPMERSSSRGSQTDLPAEASAVLDEIVEETFENATQPQPSIPDSVVPPKDLESDRIRTVLESRPNSPGVDPRKAMPITAEDAAQLPEPLVDGLGSHDVPHKAKTAHLPPQDVQERKLRLSEMAHEQDQAGNLSINLPPRDGGRHAEPLSSPGSTVDAQSATTPAMHDASTDTSPENESRYDADRMDTKEDDPPTPPELKQTPEEVAEKNEHDKILKARMDIARAEILRHSPNAGEDEPMEDEAGIPDAGIDDSRTAKEPSVNGEQENSDQLTKEANEIVEDAAEDDDEVVAVPTPGEQSGGSASNAGPTGPNEPEKQPEIADSEAEDTSPVDAMDVDATTVKDSFESSTSTALASGLATSPVESEGTDSGTKPTSEPKKTFTTPAASTPRKTTPIPATVPSTSERMTTRVASGAMRHKSVSEILGEIPKPNTTSSSERSATKVDSDSTGNSHSPSRSTTPQSPGTRVRSLVEKAKEKERSKLSTVIFPGRPPKPGSHENAALQNGQPPETSKGDYFMPLFLATASTDKRGVPSLDNLLAAAHKTITTSNAYVPIEENQTAKVLKRIYNLQSSNKWSLRQPKRAPEPVRPTTHWDVLLQEAKWMRTDFREERKWKMTTARNLAFACAEWKESNPEDRKLLQVKAKPPKPAETGESRDIEMGEGSSQAGTHPTPELINSGDDSPLDDEEEEPRLDLTETVSPTAIFALQDDDVVFGLRRSPTTDKLLNELPMYGTPLQVPQSDLPTSNLDPDRSWKRLALPLSKYIEGRMELKMEPPPRKRSRFEYEQEDDEEDLVVFGEQGAKRPTLAPEKTDVALFNPEHKHIRDRIHSSHQFRPPSEFPMPLQTFFECRVASQWTYEEDNELKNHVRDYQYNWSLISSLLTSKSLFTSGAERRTPWECFERWIHLEGLPADMQKTHYFRAYTNRIEQANRLVMAQQAQAQAQQNANSQVPPPRRRPTTSFRVERRRNQKHLTLVDAMRKLAKKRETSLQKQQHAAGMAAMRKANEAAPNPAVASHNLARTPQAFSRMRQEQDEKMRERMIHLQQRQEQQRRNVLLQQRAAQNPQQAMPNGVPQQRPNPAGTPTQSGQNLTVPGQNRPRPMPPQMQGGQPMPNGLRVPQMQMNGVPALPMQGQLPMPNPALDVGLVTRAHQISQHQQAMIRQQQGQIPGQSPQMHNSPPRMNGMPQPGFPMQNNMMPPFNPNANGVSTPPGHALSPPGQAGSPRMSQHPLNPQPNAMSMQLMEQQIKLKYPTATPEQIMGLIQQNISKAVQHQQRQGLGQGIAQSAMNAAAGGNPMGMNGMGAGQGTPQLYAQMLRQQQEAQQREKQLQAQQQASNAIANGQQGQINENRNSNPGHAHRGSSGSVQSGK